MLSEEARVLIRVMRDAVYRGWRMLVLDVLYIIDADTMIRLDLG